MRVYSDHKWLLQGSRTPADPLSAPKLPFTDEDAYKVPSPGQQASWILWRRLVDNAKAGSGKPTFKFIHIFTTHSPFFLDEECVQITKEEYEERGRARTILEQSICAMTQVLGILDRLREFGILDETLVILAADHGSPVNLVAGENGEIEEMKEIKGARIPGFAKVLPLLLVKPIGAKGPLRVSQAPVSLVDIPNTVVADMGIEQVFPGRALQDAKEGETRTRVYFDYKWEHSFWFADGLPPLTEFRVNGPARDPASWSKGRSLQPDGGK
jgi:phosphoglycerol transferase MdoB-like AlkP superfamily enzyme